MKSRAPDPKPAPKPIEHNVARCMCIACRHARAVEQAARIKADVDAGAVVMVLDLTPPKRLRAKRTTKPAKRRR